MTLPGYVLNAEGSDYHYISISRLHAQRAGLGPQDPPECAASALHGGGPEGAQSQAGLESGTKAEGPALQYPPCTRPEEPRGIWPWPTNETCIRADVGSLPDKGSHAQSEVRLGAGAAARLGNTLPGPGSLSNAAPGTGASYGGSAEASTGQSTWTGIPGGGCTGDNPPVPAIVGL